MSFFSIKNQGNLQKTFVNNEVLQKQKTTTNWFTLEFLLHFLLSLFNNLKKINSQTYSPNTLPVTPFKRFVWKFSKKFKWLISITKAETLIIIVRSKKRNLGNFRYVRCYKANNTSIVKSTVELMFFFYQYLL